MATKDKEYAEHLRQLEADRPKEFVVSICASADDYVRQWCVDNGLKLDAEAVRMKKAKRAKRTAGPKGKLP